MQKYSGLNAEQTTGRDYQSSYDLEGTAKVLFVNYEREPYLVISRTLFHPQGGGQRSDRGTINGVPVLKVINNGNYIQHFVEPIDGFFVGQEVDISIDREWRLMCSRLHTAGHLIAGVIEEGYPELRAIAGHHWPGESRVEFEGDCDVPELGFLSAVNSRLTKVIAENVLVHAQCAEGVGRLVQVGQYTPVPCGGTHVRATGELDNVQIVSARNKKGKFRVSYEVAV